MQTSPTAEAPFVERAHQLIVLRDADLFTIKFNYHLNGHPELCDTLTHDSDVNSDGPFNTIADPANLHRLRVFYEPTNKIMTITNPSRGLTPPPCRFQELVQAILGGFGLQANTAHGNEILSAVSSRIQSFTPEDFSDQLGSWTDKFNEALEHRLTELQANLTDDDRMQNTETAYGD